MADKLAQEKEGAGHTDKSARCPLLGGRDVSELGRLLLHIESENWSAILPISATLALFLSYKFRISDAMPAAIRPTGESPMTSSR